MKKRALPILLVVAMLITALAITAMAADTPVAPNDVSEYARTELSAVLKDAQVNTTAYCPVCNDDVLWRPVDISNTNGYYFTGEHRYLTADASTTTYFRIGANSTGCFYLNGHDITVSNGNPAFENASGATMNIIGNGTETVTGVGYGNLALYGDTLHTYGGTMNLFGGIYQKSSTDAGPIVGANKAYTLNVYNGTTIQNGVNSGNSGGNICAPVAGSSINIYGGTVTGGQATNGGNIYANDGTVTISGGSVTGGVATSQGGNIYANAGTLNISGTAQITGGNAPVDGGNAYITGTNTTTITGGTISGGTAKTRFGGNLAVEDAKATISGGTIENGTAGSSGGNIYLFPAAVGNYGVTVSGSAQIKGGSAPFGAGIDANGKLEISGGTHTGGTASTHGAFIAARVSTSAVTISGGNITGGTVTYSTGWGGVLYAEGNAVCNLSGGTITGGSAYNGGAFGINNATFNFTGGTVTGGQATNGGNLYLHENATKYGTVNINNNDGGSVPSVSNGTATGVGGNIYLNVYSGKTVTVSGLSVSNGSAPNGGSLALYGSGTLNMNNVTVTGGTATSMGGNAYVSGIKLALNNCSISTGKITEDGTWNIGGNFYVEGSAAQLTIAGTTTVSGGEAYNGGNIAVHDKATVLVQGGEISGGEADVNGGNIYMYSGTLTSTGGSLSAGRAGSNGGSVFIRSGCTGNLSGLTVTGGSAPYGGAFAVSGTTLTLTDCAVSGGNASSWGGNFYVEGNGTGKVIVAGTTTVSDGQASMGGNITVHDNASLEIQSGEISGGVATNYGGNIFMNKGTLTQMGGTVKNGTSNTERGGNLYVEGTATANISEATYEGGSAASYGGSIYSLGTLTLTDTSVSGGKTTGTPGTGGNLFINGGTATISGGSFANGEAKSGGNIYTGANTASASFSGTVIENGTAGTGGNVYISGATTFTNCEFTVKEGASGTGTQIYNDALVTLNSCTLNDGVVFADGGVTVNGGNVNYIYIRQGQLTLDGAAQVSGVDMNKYNTTYATLLVKSTFTGEATVNALASIPEGFGYGKTLDSKYTADGDFTGKLILSWLDSKPWAFNDDGALVVGNARTVKEGVTSWHKDNASAVQNYNGADWLIPGSVDLPLAGGTYTVNVAGIDLNVTGTGTVTFFDTANKDFMSYGKLTVAETVTVANEFATEAPDGNTYYMVESEGKLSFHRLGIKVNGVSVRPSVAGIYYTSKWECDDLLKTKIKYFGVAVSLVHQPNAQFLEDDYCLYTQFGGGEFVSGETKTSVLITEIMKAGADNATRGTKPIYATAYVLLDNGSGITSVVDNGGVHYSLQDTMKLLDDNEALYNANKEAIDAFYATWESVMSTWGFERIGKSAQTI